MRVEIFEDFQRANHCSHRDYESLEREIWELRAEVAVLRQRGCIDSNVECQAQ